MKRGTIINELQPSGGRVAEPERLLFIAVIAQAVVDATSPAPTRHRDAARSFVFASVGPTCEHFNAVCDWAGVPPDFVVRFVRGAVASGHSVPQLAISYALSLGKEPR